MPFLKVYQEGRWYYHFGINGNWRSIVLLPLVIFIERKQIMNNEDTDGFQSSCLMTAWEEDFLMPRVEENDKILVNGYAGI